MKAKTNLKAGPQYKISNGFCDPGGGDFIRVNTAPIR